METTLNEKRVNFINYCLIMAMAAIGILLIIQGTVNSMGQAF